jgi:hypothetical protein
MCGGATESILLRLAIEKDGSEENFSGFIVQQVEDER